MFVRKAAGLINVVTGNHFNACIQQTTRKPTSATKKIHRNDLFANAV